MIQRNLKKMNEMKQCLNYDHEDRIVSNSNYYELKNIISDGVRIFYRVGKALLRMKEEKLYLKEYSTFEEMCEKEWGFSNWYGYKLISAAETIDTLKESLDNCPMPQTESQVRELRKLPIEDQVEVWEELTDELPIEEITAKVIATKVEEKKEHKVNPNVLWDASHSEEKNEWYTPSHIIELVKHCLNSIELDPASCEEANQEIKAKRYFTIEDNALEQDWACKTLFMNPPYSNGDITRFADKFLEELVEINQAILLVAAFPETNWCQRLLSKCSALCFIKGRVGFVNPNKEITEMPRWGNILIYFGDKPKKFYNTFSEIGKCFLNTV